MELFVSTTTLVRYNHSLVFQVTKPATILSLTDYNKTTTSPLAELRAVDLFTVTAVSTPDKLILYLLRVIHSFEIFILAKVMAFRTW